MFEKIVNFIREIYHTNDLIHLHEPLFIGNEKKYLNECIDSTYVSSVGKFVDNFEEIAAVYTGAKYAVVVVNGTEALHLALNLVGVKTGDEVITQPLTFIATSNAISYTGAVPLFLDVDRDTMGLSPSAIEDFLMKNGEIIDGKCINRLSGCKISACVPMHTFGHPVKIDQVVEICDRYHIPVIEDAAESIGSTYKGKQTGTYGKAGILSFNGNKIITSGGGGMIITSDETVAKHAKHLSTQAKIPHKWNFSHDEIGYNYRMPNINAALGVAQFENLDLFLQKKRELASIYQAFFRDLDIGFFSEPLESRSNYWLNTLIFSDRGERDAFLEFSNNHGVMTRPAWTLMNRLELFKDCLAIEIQNAQWLEDRVVNIPSSVIM